MALHTEAGEGDHANDKLSRLKTVTSGYGPLFYGKNRSYKTFKTSCEEVWDRMVQGKVDLPKLLVSSGIMRTVLGTILSGQYYDFRVIMICILSLL